MADGLTVMVTGGAGYIGGQTVLALLECGHTVIVIDDLSTGRRATFHDKTHFYEGCVQDAVLLAKVFDTHRIDAVLHFAASIEVDVSLKLPLAYYDNNLVATSILVDAAQKAGVKTFILSSTAAVYGNVSEAVSEDLICAPINPYGWSKLFAENIVKNACAVSRMKYGVLRYFNVIGADRSGRHGPCTNKPTHLISRCFHALENGTTITVYGNDFDTPDGSGVRDYIDVVDLASAHIKTLEYLREGGVSETFNLGYSEGHSVFDVLKAVEHVAGRNITYEIGDKRKGDPAAVIADISKLNKLLGWKPEFNNLPDSIRRAYDWYCSASVKPKWE
jgi:UDP-glucose 4-epimerase